jgi:hypothetical protein
VLRVAEERCNVVPGRAADADLTIRCDGALFLAVHRGEASAVLALLSGRIRLSGRRRLFLAFPRLFPVYPSDSVSARVAWRLTRFWQRIAARR